MPPPELSAKLSEENNPRDKRTNKITFFIVVLLWRHSHILRDDASDDLMQKDKAPGKRKPRRLEAY
jgi:hypothetical protein